MGTATTSGSADEAVMRRAVALAGRGPLGDPNPRVGAVVLDARGDVVGEGWHRGAGTPHAEAEALRVAGDSARGGTCYVTLEPCDHEGRTPACSQALLAAGIARVVVAGRDPNPVAAGGLARLRAAGVSVTDGVLADAAEGLNREWLHALRSGRPFVTWKVASTLDGRIAAADGTSRWITGPEARRDVHALRARVGAVLVGTGTALIDDPALTVRLDRVAGAGDDQEDDRDASPRNERHADAAHDGGVHAWDGRRPLRVVMGERVGDLPADARVLDDTAPTLLLPTREPSVALAALHERGVRHVLLEGGGRLAAAFLRKGLVDEIVAYLAPTLLGAGASCVGDLGITTIAQAQRLDVTDVRTLGRDVRLTLSPERS